MQTLTYGLLDRLLEIAEIKIAGGDFDKNYALGYISATIDMHEIMGKCEDASNMYLYIWDKLEKQ